MNKIILVSLIMLAACGTSKQNQIETAKKEILATEREFAEFCKKEGRAAAFFKYADSSAVINRGDSLYKGSHSVKDFYAARPLKNTTLDWWPDFVDVSSSCDLGYTYGRYIYSVTDSTGKVTENKGHFHTVWKKQHDGTWRFVWD